VQDELLRVLPFILFYYADKSARHVPIPIHSGDAGQDFIGIGITVEMFPICVTDFIGRQLRRFDEVERNSLEYGVAKEELDRWNGSMEDADVQGTFFAMTPIVLMAGSKP